MKSLKNALRPLIRRIWGVSIEVIDLKIVFHKDANLYGTHGHLKATHVDSRNVEQTVRFAFIGVSTPPALTPRIVNYIWEEAQAQGYTPIEIAKYGMVIPTDAQVRPSALVSEARRRAEGVRAATVDGIDKRVDNVAALTPQQS